MKEEGWSFIPKTNNKINKNISADVITRNSEFLQRKTAKIEQKTNEIDNEYKYMPKIINK